MSLSETNFLGIDHHSVISSDINKSKFFFLEIMGLEIAPGRPPLPFDGAWFKIGGNSGQTLHCLCLPNSDPVDNRPEHGGVDRHVAVRIADLEPLIERLEHHGVTYTRSKSGRRAIFFRDPDGNAIEVIEAIETFVD
jgi:glyoxylase I family protein